MNAVNLIVEKWCLSCKTHNHFGTFENVLQYKAQMQRVRAAAAAAAAGAKLMHESCMRRGGLALYHILQRSKDTDVSLKQRQ